MAIKVKVLNENNIGVKVNSEVVKGTTDSEKLSSQMSIYSEMNKSSDYLYPIKYDGIDETWAIEHIKNNNDFIIGACSGVVTDTLAGRNFDWLYNNQVSFWVECESSPSHLAYKGVATSAKLTKDICEFALSSDIHNNSNLLSKTDNEAFRELPFHMCDGINEKGIYIQINVAPLKEGEDITIYHGDSYPSVCESSVPSYILAHATSALDAKDILSNKINIYANKVMRDDQHYKSHYLVKDFNTNTSFVAEFKDGEMVYTNVPFMTNFDVNGVEFPSDNHLPTPYEGGGATLLGVYEYGSGLERWNIIAENYNSNMTELEMAGLLDDLLYSNAYTLREPASKVWCTEFVNEEKSRTIDSPYSHYASALSTAAQMWAARDRDNPAVWHSCHSVIYNYEAKTASVISQEDASTTQTFSIEFGGGGAGLSPEQSERLAKLDARFYKAGGEDIYIDLENDVEITTWSTEFGWEYGTYDTYNSQNLPAQVTGIGSTNRRLADWSSYCSTSYLKFNAPANGKLYIKLAMSELDGCGSCAVVSTPLEYDYVYWDGYSPTEDDEFIAAITQEGLDGYQVIEVDIKAGENYIAVQYNDFNCESEEGMGRCVITEIRLHTDERWLLKNIDSGITKEPWTKEEVESVVKNVYIGDVDPNLTIVDENKNAVIPVINYAAPMGTWGLVRKGYDSYGLAWDAQNGYLMINPTTDANIKNRATQNYPRLPLVGSQVDLIVQEGLSNSRLSWTNAQKAAARNLIGAGSSNFDGRYASLSGRPTIPSALSDLSDSASSRHVSDDDMEYWDTKQDASTLDNDVHSKGYLKLADLPTYVVEVVQEPGSSTTSVMSQKAVTDYVQTSGISVTKFSPSAVIAANTSVSMTSVYRYNPSNCWLVSWLQRPLAIASSGTMAYKNGMNIVTLQKDANNYLQYYYIGYEIKLINVKNGTTVNTQTLLSFGSSGGNINSNLNEYCELDILHKRLKHVKYISGSYVTLYSFDFSTWDITHLTEFNILTGAHHYQTPVAVINLRINYMFGYESLLSQKIKTGNYNCFEQTIFKEMRVIPSKVQLGGTLSLNEKHHKIATGSNASSTYIPGGLGVTNDGGTPSSCAFSFKIKLLSGTLKLASGASNSKGTMIYDTSGNLVYSLTPGTSASFDLVVGTTYEIFCATSNTLNYAGAYHFYGKGDWEVEVWDNFAYDFASQNYCSETYENGYFVGAIPMQCKYQSWTVPEQKQNTMSTAPSDVPYLAECTDTNGKIYMYNGTAWKQINNS